MWRFSGYGRPKEMMFTKITMDLVGKFIGSSPMIFPWKIDGFLWFPVDPWLQQFNPRFRSSLTASLMSMQWKKTGLIQIDWEKRACHALKVKHHSHSQLFGSGNMRSSGSQNDLTRKVLAWGFANHCQIMSKVATSKARIETYSTCQRWGFPLLCSDVFTVPWYPWYVDGCIWAGYK